MSHQFEYFTRLIIVSLITLCLISCDGMNGGEDGSEEPPPDISTDDFVIAKITGMENINNSISIMAITKDASEAFGVLVEKDVSGNPTFVTGAFYISNLNDAFIVKAGPDGLPELIVDSTGVRIVFENYTESTVDVSVFDADGKIIGGPTTVSVNASDLMLIKELYSSIFSETIFSNDHDVQGSRIFNFDVFDKKV